MKLEFKNVTKQYGEVNAVNKVNCVMEKGILWTAWSKWSRKDHIKCVCFVRLFNHQKDKILWEW